MERNKFFLYCVFSQEEIDQILKKQSIVESVAARFCAKESFFKCVGEGVKKLESLKSVKILNSGDGAPQIILDGELLNKYKKYKFSVSLSHCKEYAISVVFGKKFSNSTTKFR